MLRTFHLAVYIPVLTLALALASGSASAQSHTARLGRVSAPSVEVFAGPPVRTHRTIIQSIAQTGTHQPDRGASAWRAFQQWAGGSWRAVWDADTRVPLTIFGSGIAAPGANASAASAQRHSLDLLNRHIALLAPGAQASDFVADSVIAGQRDWRGLRTVVLQQHHRGVPVRGGTLSFTFKRDRLIVISSTAWPDVATHLATHLKDAPGRSSARPSTISEKNAQERARAWIAGDHGGDARVVGMQSPQIVALARPSATGADMAYVPAQVVTVATDQRLGRWRVYIDQHTGEPVLRESLLRAGTGQLLYNAPERWPGGARRDWPATYAETTVNAEFVLSDGAGYVTWPDTGNPADIFARPRGQYVWVEDQTGTDPVFNDALADGGTAVWDAQADELTDAMLTTFVHLGIAKEWVAALDPAAGWVGDNLLAEVNLAQACNAFYDAGADSLHFYQRGDIDGVTCGNTGRLPDVIYHEFGHALHNHSLVGGQFDLAFSEGASDYFAATLTGDPAIGVGFFESPDSLRHINPPGREYVWPDDIDTFDPHNTGLIFAGAMWDLRVELIAELGQEAGVAHADALYYSAIQRASDIPSSYAFVLAADDDDGDLSNGTPNRCAIDRAFGAHGLALGEFSTAVALDGPMHDGLNVYFLMSEPDDPQCPVVGIADAVLSWQVRGDPGVAGSELMTADAGLLSARMPQIDENLVLQYRVTVEYENGATLAFPGNPAAPYYEQFVGGVVPHYCTDFESEPYVEGWTSVSQRGLDSWAWGVSTGVGGDPPRAYSGERVMGTNLVNGSYPLLSLSQLVGPVVEVAGHDNVRLQYRRWLNVEDGKWDNARIRANSTLVWDNLTTEDGLTNHTDREWRFHDIDITATVTGDPVTGGTVQFLFELESDDIIELGGWTIDDVCVVSYMETICGDGIATTWEQCDDGAGNSDSQKDACRSNCVAAYCGDGVTDSQEQCDDGNNIDGDSCNNACIGENPPFAGCCQTGGASPDMPVLAALVMFGLLAMRRRRRTHRVQRSAARDVIGL